MIFVLAITSKTWAQRSPGVGYIYPAGGQQGATFEVKMAGRFLDGVAGAVVSGDGVQVTVIEHVKPLNGKQLNLLRDRLKEIQQILNLGQAGRLKNKAKEETRTQIDPNVIIDRPAMQKEMAEIREKLANPKNRNRDNPQLAEDVTLRVVVASDARLGRRELRLQTAMGLSNPVAFYVGQLPECIEHEPNNKIADQNVPSILPLVINGRIEPGDVDRFCLNLDKGTRLVMAVSARELIPYLADAVPGWFQATLALYDPNGNEVAYDDDYRFHPDPVLYYEIPTDGKYTLEIRDAIYRGREDFVYRIAIGQSPFITSIFPLGGRTDDETTVQLKGWNLPTDKMTLNAENREQGVLPISVCAEQLVSNHVPFAVDSLPQSMEKEPNNRQAEARMVSLPIIINGRIAQPGDCDVFSFTGRAGDEIVAEIYARRLDSPLDSVLTLNDATGRKLIANDDCEDKAAGLTTHHADSMLRIKLPADGTYYLHLGDAQHKGGEAYSYRLRISPPQPDFELRIVPSTLNARAGARIPLTVYVLRKDGFSEDIKLVLKDSPRGFMLSSDNLPAQKDQVKLTLRAPPMPTKEPVSLYMEGLAVIQGRQVIRQAIPADDMTQAFIYRHLVPAKDLMVAVLRRPNPKVPTRNRNSKTVKSP